jgi:hypothetical protein
MTTAEAADPAGTAVVEAVTAEAAAAQVDTGNGDQPHGRLAG